MAARKRYIGLGPVYKAICLFLAAVLAISAAMTSVTAWRDLSQHRTNEFHGMARPESGSVILYKYERDIEGFETTIPMQNVVFSLIQLAEDGEELDLGHYQTDQHGRISLSDLSPGEYYFLEIAPPYGFSYDMDKNGNEITKYPFTINSSEDGEVGFASVAAYNPRLYADLDITKTIENSDGAPPSPEQLAMAFEFTATFSDNQTYKYAIDGGPEQEIASGGKIYLKHGQKATVKDIPVGVQYTVLETPPEEYYEISGFGNHGDQNNLPPEGSTADFINTAHAQLIVTKDVAGEDDDEDYGPDADADTDTDATYNFIATIDGVEYPFALKAGESRLFYGLRIGAAYTVSEVIPDGAPYVPAPLAYAGEITWDSIYLPIVCAFTNIYGPDEYGDLVVKKEINSQYPLSKADLEAEFRFVAAIGDDEPVEFTLKHGQTKMFEELPLGTPYKITELPRDGYLPAIGEISGYVAGREGVEITLTFDNRNRNRTQPELTFVTVTKVWGDDGDDGDEERPTSVRVQLYRDTAALGGPVTLNAENNWTHSWTGLEAGYIYTVDEVTVPEGYTKTITGSAATGFVITNRRGGVQPNLTQVMVGKIWLDSNPTTRPGSVQVQLYRDGQAWGGVVTLNARNKWTYVWTGLLTGYTYTVDEVNVPAGYAKTITGDAGDGFVITNRSADYEILTPMPPPGESPPPGETPKPPPASSPPTTIPPTVPPPDDPPKTGDDSNIWLWVALMIISAFALRWVLRGGPQQKKYRRHPL